MKLGGFLVNTLQSRSRIIKFNHWSNSEYNGTVTAAWINFAEDSEDVASFSSQHWQQPLCFSMDILQIYLNFHLS